MNATTLGTARPFTPQPTAAPANPLKSNFIQGFELNRVGATGFAGISEYVDR
ncbi:hypothetical protein N836_31475 [Leptolyngbya sp. Heron Island J]|uniref:hypothetical protein n=1 Tax=Leptolyngbya sp. Heron Island J TaxID=1385935 RepID=UPI0003B97A37|nr:hypothetical protein [Leptolyngbya sp. Heron Island J]ESA38463.1 hypothetical protein N836_31475 [Leptolyngbya sp. Heron Island J]